MKHVDGKQRNRIGASKQKERERERERKREQGTVRAMPNNVVLLLQTHNRLRVLCKSNTRKHSNMSDCTDCVDHTQADAGVPQLQRLQTAQTAELCDTLLSRLSAQHDMKPGTSSNAAVDVLGTAALDALSTTARHTLDSSASSGAASADDEFACAVLDAARLLAEDFPECKKFAAAYATLATKCSTGAEAKASIRQHFVAKCASVFERVASACDDDVMEFMFGLDEAREIDLKSKYYAYDANGRTCLVEHLKAICSLASFADTLHRAAAIMPPQFDEWTKQMLEGMSSGASLPEMFADILPKAFSVVQSMSGTDQMNLVGIMQSLAGQSASSASASTAAAFAAESSGDCRDLASNLPGIIGDIAKKYAGAAAGAGSKGSKAAGQGGVMDSSDFAQVMGMVNQAFQSMTHN